MHLSDPITSLSGVGESIAKRLSKLSINTVGDLVFHVPRSYQDFSNITTIDTMQPGNVTLRGQFMGVQSRYARRGLHITSARFKDSTGVFTMTWFKQPWRKDSLPLNQDIFISGELKMSARRFTIVNPTYELAEEVTIHTARIVPIYKQTEGITSSRLRTLLSAALDKVDLGQYSPPLLFKSHPSEMIRQIHFPSSNQQLQQAIKQWQFFDLYEYVLLGFLLRQRLMHFRSPAMTITDTQVQEFMESLPFTFTHAQQRAAHEILRHLSSAEPMNRLLQGDVGSGKTVVALLAAFAALKSGQQVAIVAPTEIVARQHLKDAKSLLSDYHPKLLSSSLTARQKSLLKNKLANGEQQLVVGTHALLQPDVCFSDLGLVVLDEQHRFGVKQRQMLAKQRDLAPHLLSMTATPIPRTLALTVFSDLDVSVIDELPPGRKPVKTTAGGPRMRAGVYAKMDEQIQGGRQVYVVCPLINESDSLGTTSVAQEIDRLKKQFPKYVIQGLHGSLKTEDKERIIADFVDGNIDILVSTTVVEVGVNVPNASVMLIEAAERFGLAQLHQLRGRVGRGEHQAYCYALTTQSGQAKDRLQAFVSTNDGFKLAEMDLKLRGSGELYGLRQSGFIEMDPSVVSNTKLISRIRELAQAFVKDYTVDDYPLLKYRLNKIRHTAQRN